jgi:hypothetical protein
MALLKIRKLAIIFALIALSAAQQTRGNSGYLKRSGPEPLRFSLATANIASFVALPASLVEKSAATNTIETASIQANTTNTATFTPPPSSSASSPNTLSVVPGSFLPNVPPAVPAASDMLVVSPQMLTEYFKPGPNGTNSATTLILPVAVGFTPPSAKPYSRATYNSP